MRIKTTYLDWQARTLAAMAGLGRREQGAASVELALVLPFLVLLVVAMIDYGTAINRKMQLTNAIRAGTQYATVRKPIEQDLTQIRQAVLDTAPADETGTRKLSSTFFCQCPDGSAVACEDECGTGERGSYVQIVLREDFPLILSYPGIGNPISLSSEAVIRLN